MIKEYEIKDSDIIFRYFIDIILWIQKNGKAKIPKCQYEDKDLSNQLIYSFLNSGIGLLEKAYTASIFNIILQSIFCEKYDESSDTIERNTLVLIFNLVKFIYDDDILSFVKTSNLWSDKVKQYTYVNVYPELNEKNKKLFDDFM